MNLYAVDYEARLENGCVHFSVMLIKAFNKKEAREKTEKIVAERNDVAWVKAKKTELLRKNYWEQLD